MYVRGSKYIPAGGIKGQGGWILMFFLEIGMGYQSRTIAQGMWTGQEI